MNIKKLLKTPLMIYIFFQNHKNTKYLPSTTIHNFYLIVSERLIDGSPQNSITAVPVGKAIPTK